MRYFDVDTVTFTTVDVGKISVKDLRPLYDGPFRFSVTTRTEVTLDEVAVRPEVYGKNGEYEAYKLFDKNAVKIVEQRFSLDLIDKLEVPE